MSDQLKRILELWKAAPGATRVALCAAASVLLVVTYLGLRQASQPSFVPLRSGLDEGQRAACEAALAEGGLVYEVSPFPGPYTIHVDAGALYRARNLVALSGALVPAEVGIPSGSTRVSSVWQTTVERLQTARKREWQECEKQLEALEFVDRATVTGSLSDTSPFAADSAPTLSVSLTLKPGVTPSPQLGKTVSKIVRFRFNAPAENVIIVDQRGRLLYDGSEVDGSSPRADDLLELESRYDIHKASIANAGLTQMFGAGMAHVTVDSEWSYDRVESVRESLDPDSKVVISELVTSSRTPVGGGSFGGGAAGTASNVGGDFGVDSAAVPRAQEGPAQQAQESGTQRTHAVGRETRHQVSNTPTLRRMSIALAVDTSLADRVPELEQWVKAALHFDDERGDRFSAFATPFIGLQRDEAGLPLPPAPADAPAETAPWLDLALERGIELLAALAFLIVLFKSLGGARKALERSRLEAPATPARNEVDPELLARRQVEELVKSDPERVGEILSRWALEEERVGAGR